MDKLLRTILHGLGIQIPPDTIEYLAAWIPTVPKLVQNFVGAMNANIKELDARIRRMEEILEVLYAERTTRSANAGAFGTDCGTAGNGFGTDSAGSGEGLPGKA